MYDIIIVGGGPAGLSAALYALRAGKHVLVLEKNNFGGQIALSPRVDNYPGLPSVSGAALTDALLTQVTDRGGEVDLATVTGLGGEAGARVVRTDGEEYAARAVILCTGARHRRLGLPREEELTGSGVSYCAVCDGAFFEDEVVAVIGGGNTAVEEACYLTQFASKVYVVHRRDSFRADRVPVEQAMANPKIVPVWDSVVESIEGGDMVERLMLRNVKTQEVSPLPVAGVFVFVGTDPNSRFVADLVETSKGGWIRTNPRMETSVEGIFAAGDVRDTYLRQVVTAAGDGATAAMAAYAYIAEQVHLQSVLLEPERVNALFTSSIDPAHVALVQQVEAWSAESGIPVSVVDGYRNGRMMEKLRIPEMPTLMKLQKGVEQGRRAVTSLEEVRAFLQ